MARHAGKETYVDALCAEMESRKFFFGTGRHRPETVYFGGGTPSCLGPEPLKRIAAALNACFDLSGLREATLECNPEDMTEDFLAGVRETGLFDRLSVGVQSFDDSMLRKLNRRHSAAMAADAVRRAEMHGFVRLSVDLIYGLPGQGVTEWARELKEVERLNRSLLQPVEHLSCYALTVEPGTMLERQIESGRSEAPDEEVQVAQYGLLQRWIADNGYSQYEVSNYCRNGQRALHNCRYWNRTPYLGLGAAAHSFDGRRRRWNVADVARYTATATDGEVEHEEETLTQRDAYNEYVMTALRTTEGIVKEMVPPPYRTHLERAAKRYLHNGLLTDTGRCLKPTADGMLQADGMAAALFG